MQWSSLAQKAKHEDLEARKNISLETFADFVVQKMAGSVQYCFTINACH
jgi:hypothetical protein